MTSRGTESDFEFEETSRSLRVEFRAKGAAAGGLAAVGTLLFGVGLPFIGLIFGLVVCGPMLRRRRPDASRRRVAVVILVPALLAPLAIAGPGIAAWLLLRWAGFDLDLPGGVDLGVVSGLVGFVIAEAGAGFLLAGATAAALLRAADGTGHGRDLGRAVRIGVVGGAWFAIPTAALLAGALVLREAAGLFVPALIALPFFVCRDLATRLAAAIEPENATAADEA